MAFGRVAARQRNQVGFAPIVQLAIPVGLGMVVQDALQPLFGVPPFGAEHRALRRVQSRHHLGGTPPFVSLEQDARPIDDPSGMPPTVDQSQ